MSEQKVTIRNIKLTPRSKLGYRYMGLIRDKDISYEEYCERTNRFLRKYTDKQMETMTFKDVEEYIKNEIEESWKIPTK